MKHTLFILIALLLWSCNSTTENTTEEIRTEESNKIKAQDDSTLIDSNDGETTEKKDIKTIGKVLLKAFSDKNYSMLAPYLKDENSVVLFAPYLYIDTTRAQELTLEELKQYDKEKKILDWGWYDGSGDAIELSVSDYVDRFVYDVDYLNETDTITMNHVHFKGNSLNNISEVFPESNYIHFYRAPKDPELGEMDWRSIIFVFEEFDKKYYLKAVVHNEWTI